MASRFQKQSDSERFIATRRKGTNEARNVTTGDDAGFEMPIDTHEKEAKLKKIRDQVIIEKIMDEVILETVKFVDGKRGSSKVECAAVKTGWNKRYAMSGDPYENEAMQKWLRENNQGGSKVKYIFDLTDRNKGYAMSSDFYENEAILKKMKDYNQGGSNVKYVADLTGGNEGYTIPGDPYQNEAILKWLRKNNQGRSNVKYFADMTSRNKGYAISRDPYEDEQSAEGYAMSGDPYENVAILKWMRENNQGGSKVNYVFDLTDRNNRYAMSREPYENESPAEDYAVSGDQYENEAILNWMKENNRGRSKVKYFADLTGHNKGYAMSQDPYEDDASAEGCPMSGDSYKNEAILKWLWESNQGGSKGKYFADVTGRNKGYAMYREPYEKEHSAEDYAISGDPYENGAILKWMRENNQGGSKVKYVFDQTDRNKGYQLTDNSYGNELILGKKMDDEQKYATVKYVADATGLSKGNQIANDAYVDNGILSKMMHKLILDMMMEDIQGGSNEKVDTEATFVNRTRHAFKTKESAFAVGKSLITVDLDECVFDDVVVSAIPLTSHVVLRGGIPESTPIDAKVRKRRLSFLRAVGGYEAFDRRGRIFCLVGTRDLKDTGEDSISAAGDIDHAISWLNATPESG